LTGVAGDEDCREGRAKFEHLSPHSLIRDVEAAHDEEFLDISKLSVKRG
jgi:hypothetical protein